MAKTFALRKVLLLMLSSGACIASQYANAAAFQLFEQDGASVGNYHAGRAATAEDASTAFYNPAGLVRIKNQELVLGLDPIITDMKFHGTVNVNIPGLGATGPVNAAAQGGALNFVPNLNYAAPISDRFVFGFSIVAPFGLNTDYGKNSYTRYASTMTSLYVIDFVPSLAVAITDKLSVGAGIDIERASAEFDLVAGSSLLDEFAQGANQDTNAQNTGGDHAYGYHLGGMYQFTPDTRVGLAFASRVNHVIHGTSQFAGPLANDSSEGNQIGPSLRAQIPLPSTTTLSLFHTINPAWDIMGSLIYTKWSALQQLVLTGVSAIEGGNSRPNAASGLPGITVVVPENFRNTWNISVGANYHFNDEWILRTGLGFDETPTNNRDRNLQLPDSNRIALALGTHFQPIKAIGLDVAWTHIFAMNTRINNTIVMGDQSTTVVGSMHASADVYGFQFKWDIA